MNRRVIVVDFYWTRDKDPRVPRGHASILTALRERGLDGGSDGLGRWALVETDDPGSRSVGVPTPPPRG